MFLFWMFSIDDNTLYLNVDFHVFVSDDKFGLFVAYRVPDAARLDTGQLVVRVFELAYQGVEGTAEQWTVIVTNVNFKIARRTWYKCGQVIARVSNVNSFAKWIFKLIVDFFLNSCSVK